MAKQQRMGTVTFAAVLAAVVPSAWQPLLERPTGWGTMAFALVLIIAGEIVTVIRRLFRIGRVLKESPQPEDTP